MEQDKQIVDLMKIITEKEEEKCTILIDGGFSCGKKTIVNALVGQSAAITSADPFGREGVIIDPGYEKDRIIRIIRYYSDGTTYEWENFSAYHSNTINSYGESGSSDIRYIDVIQLSETDFDDRVSFIIISSVCKNDSILDYSRIYDNATAVIFMRNATTPVDHGEISLFEQTYFLNNLQKAFFVINYRDLISGEFDNESVKQYLKDRFCRPVTKQNDRLVCELLEQRLFCLSARNAIKNRNHAPISEDDFSRLEKELRTYISTALPEKQIVRQATAISECLASLRNIVNDMGSSDYDIMQLNKEKRHQDAVREV